VKRRQLPPAWWNDAQARTHNSVVGQFWLAYRNRTGHCWLVRQDAAGRLYADTYLGTSTTPAARNTLLGAGEDYYRRSSDYVVADTREGIRALQE
jgi:hypothetical protein